LEGVQHLELKPINLLELPITKITGEFIKLAENKNIIFPQIQNILNSDYSLNTPFVYDGFYLNNRLIYIYNRQDIDVVLYNLNTLYQTPDFKGFCVFGSIYFVFYQNKCLVIDTLSDKVKTLNLTIDNAYQNIIKVKQLTPQLFTIITSDPTTIHLFGLDSTGAIASADDGSTVNINSFSYSSFSNPVVNVDLIKLKDEIYLIGDDFTVLLNMHIKDIIYLQTKETFDYRYSPFQEFENSGIAFVKETQSFFVFYNTLYNSYIYITKDMKNFYFGEETIFLTPNVCFKLQDDNFYITSDILQNEFVITADYHEINFRLNTTYTIFKSASIKIPELQKEDTDRVASLTIETRYDNGYNIWSYGIIYNKSNYRILARGDEFVITLHSNNALRIEEFLLWA
jgi:hypothetical protein